MGGGFLPFHDVLLTLRTCCDHFSTPITGVPRAFQAPQEQKGEGRWTPSWQPTCTIWIPL